jgi:hypothetical protein
MHIYLIIISFLVTDNHQVTSLSRRELCMAAGPYRLARKTCSTLMEDHFNLVIHLQVGVSDWLHSSTVAGSDCLIMVPEQGSEQEVCSVSTDFGQELWKSPESAT